MSEFQHYEFLAVDRPLDVAAQKALRAISSRAKITSRSFVNEYHWGDLKADPTTLMRRYFDVFVYWANWGSRDLSLRVPDAYLVAADIAPYLTDAAFTCLPAPGGSILAFAARELEVTYLDEAEEATIGETFARLRAELLEGDRRLLYLAWLLGVQTGEVDDGAQEPPCPPGLGRLSEAQTDFAVFMHIDNALIAAAAQGDSATPQAGVTRQQIAACIAGLPDADKNALLERVAIDADSLVGPELRRRAAGPPAACRSRDRSAGDLLEASVTIGLHRAQEAAAAAEAARARTVAEAKAAQLARAAALAGREDAAWQQVDLLIEQRKAKEYGAAVQLLGDLAALAETRGATASFASAVTELRQRHATKRTMLQRIDQAGLPQA